MMWSKRTMPSLEVVFPLVNDQPCRESRLCRHCQHVALVCTRRYLHAWRCMQVWVKVCMWCVRFRSAAASLNCLQVQLQVPTAQVCCSRRASSLVHLHAPSRSVCSAQTSLDPPCSTPAYSATLPQSSFTHMQTTSNEHLRTLSVCSHPARSQSWSLIAHSLRNKESPGPPRE